MEMGSMSIDSDRYKVRITDIKLDSSFLSFSGKVIDKLKDPNKEYRFSDYTDLTDFTWDDEEIEKEIKNEKRK